MKDIETVKYDGSTQKISRKEQKSFKVYLFVLAHFLQAFLFPLFAISLAFEQGDIDMSKVLAIIIIIALSIHSITFPFSKEYRGVLEGEIKK